MFLLLACLGYYIMNLQSHYENLSDKHSKLERTLESLLNDFNQLKSDLSTDESAVDDLNSTLSDTINKELSNANLTKKIRSKEAKLEKRVAVLTLGEHDQNSELDDLSSKYEELSNKNTGIEQSLLEISQAHDDLVDTLSHLDFECGRAKEKCSCPQGKKVVLRFRYLGLNKEAHLTVGTSA